MVEVITGKMRNLYIFFFYFWFSFLCITVIMKLNEVQNNINNVEEYILLLPIHEQIYEINKILDYHMNYNHPRL